MTRTTMTIKIRCTQKTRICQKQQMQIMSYSSSDCDSARILEV